MRPIDAEKLKRGIKNHCAMPIWCHELVKAEIDETPTIDPYGTWIPCSERLPEDSRDVILTTRSYVVGVGFFDARHGNWVQWYGGGGLVVDVIAWMSMPLPEPYREEKKDE